jgi:FdhD protein
MSVPSNRPTGSVSAGDATRRVAVHRIGANEPAIAGRDNTFDRVAVEAPLQVLVNGEPFAVIMRTPGDDRDLAAGFLHAEGCIAAADDIIDIASSWDASSREVVAVTLGPSAAGPASQERRRVDVNAACGMCGRVRVESIEIDRPPLAAHWTVPTEFVSALPARLRAEQRVFDETGGLHAAGIFARSGEQLALAEDVGRHNAVDKVVGRLLMDGRLPLSDAILVVSGRLAYEIVQKAFLAGIPFVTAVSAPSSLAVDLAVAAGITLAGFVRGGGFNVSAHGERIA